MRTALLTLILALSTACASTALQQPAVAADASAEADIYEQYVDSNGHVVTTQAPQAKAQPTKQSAHSRLFDHWTSAYMFAR